MTRKLRRLPPGSVTSGPRGPGRLATIERIAVDLIAFAFLARAALLAFSAGFQPQVVLGVVLALVVLEAQTLRS